MFLGFAPSALAPQALLVQPALQALGEPTGLRTTTEPHNGILSAFVQSGTQTRCLCYTRGKSVTETRPGKFINAVWARYDKMTSRI